MNTAIKKIKNPKEIFNFLTKLFDEASPIYEDMEKNLENGHLIKTRFEIIKEFIECRRCDKITNKENSFEYTYYPNFEKRFQELSLELEKSIYFEEGVKLFNKEEWKDVKYNLNDYKAFKNRLNALKVSINKVEFKMRHERKSINWFLKNDKIKKKHEVRKYVKKYSYEIRSSRNYTRAVKKFTGYCDKKINELTNKSAPEGVNDKFEEFESKFNDINETLKSLYEKMRENNSEALSTLKISDDANKYYKDEPKTSEIRIQDLSTSIEEANIIQDKINNLMDEMINAKDFENRIEYVKGYQTKINKLKEFTEQNNIYKINTQFILDTAREKESLPNKIKASQT